MQAFVSSTPTFGLATTAVRAGRPRDPNGPVAPPIVQSTTFAQESVGDAPAFTYSRAANPTVSALEDALCALEGARGCTAYATGMGALTTLCVALLHSGDRVICSDVAYGGTDRLLRRILAPFGVRAEFVDTSDLERVADAVPGARLVIVETPANPTLKLADIAQVAEICRRHGALLAVDNTFLTAVAQRPLDLGADLVIYSTTKYVEGHNLATGGALLTADEGVHQRLAYVRKALGTIQAPFPAWLTLRGLQTLPLRLRAHAENAAIVARFLAAHPDVAHVAWPFLETFPQRDLAVRQQACGGGIVAFEPAGGSARARAFLDALQLCIRAESLGAAETLVTHPVTMTHGDVPEAERRRAGIGDALIRLSVGLEDPADVVADLDQALHASAEVRS